jgi:HlyD family secretion protein
MWAIVSSKGGGTVREVLVKPGHAVASDEVLVRLDTTDLALSLRAAEQEMAAQRAALEQLTSRADDEVVARAEREHAYQVAQAEVDLEMNREELERTRAQDPAADVAAARARIHELELQLAEGRVRDPAPDLTAARVHMERVRIALEDTRIAYQQALDRPWKDQAHRDKWHDRLEQAKLDYRLAQARLDGAEKAERAHAIHLEALKAQLKEAQAQLAQAIHSQEAYSHTLQILDLQVETAQLQLERLRSWDNPHLDTPLEAKVDQAEAHVEQARWSVAQIEEQIQDAKVQAPFAGTVGAVHVQKGELVSAGQALVTLGDLQTLRVETTDLNEIDVARVAVGQQVTLTFDAFPDRDFSGQVTRISPMAETDAGGVNYRVIVKMDRLDPAVRWGMTAFVDIQVGDQ